MLIDGMECLDSQYRNALLNLLGRVREDYDVIFVFKVCDNDANEHGIPLDWACKWLVSAKDGKMKLCAAL